MVALLIGSGAQIDAIDDHHWTPLFFACQEGHLKTVETLVSLGASVHARSSDSVTPLMIAVQTDSPQTVEYLISKGARVNDVDDKNSTALWHWAERYIAEAVAVELISSASDEARTPAAGALGMLAEVEELIPMINVLKQEGVGAMLGNNLKQICFNSEAAAKNREAAAVLCRHGADINARTAEHNWTLLMMAAGCNLPALVESLISLGADVHAKDDNDFTALQIAAEIGSVDCVRMLIEAQANLNSVDKTGATVLIHAVNGGNLATVELLLQNGANVDQRGGEFGTALCAACCNSHENQKDIVKLLLNYSVDVNSVCDDGDTPLMLCIRYGDEELVKMLLDAGAIPGRLGTADTAVCTPLFRAIAWKQYSLLQLLISRGADVNEAVLGGVTPLLMAAETGDLEAVKILMCASADLNVVTEGERTAVFLAANCGNLEIVRALAEAGANVDIPSSDGVTALHSVLEAGDAATVAVLIRCGANVHRRAAGVPSICLATDAGSAACVQLLIDAEANVDAVDNDGSTGLHRAAFLGYAECLQKLVSAGANPDIVNNAGFPPLHIACKEGQVQIVEMLLKGGPDTHLEVEFMKSAVHVAAEAGHSNVAEQILSVLRTSGDETAEKTTKTVVNNLDDTLCCPITLELMQDPVVAADGHSYEREAITEWLQRHGTSPVTKQLMSAQALVPNLNLKHQIEVYRSHNRL